MPTLSLKCQWTQIWVTSPNTDKAFKLLRSLSQIKASSIDFSWHEFLTQIFFFPSSTHFRSDTRPLWLRMAPQQQRQSFTLNLMSNASEQKTNHQEARIFSHSVNNQRCSLFNKICHVIPFSTRNAFVSVDDFSASNRKAPTNWITKRENLMNSAAVCAMMMLWSEEKFLLNP